MLRDILYIALGGAVGAVARYAIGLAAVRWLGTGFPYGILAVNVAGCLAIGVLGAVIERRETQLSSAQEAAGKSEPAASEIHADALLRLVRFGLMVGFLGGLTTFSSFGLDTVKLIELQRMDLALANVALNVIAGLAAVWAGLWVGRAILP